MHTIKIGELFWLRSINTSQRHITATIRVCLPSFLSDTKRSSCEIPMATKRMSSIALVAISDELRVLNPFGSNPLYCYQEWWRFTIYGALWPSILSTDTAIRVVGHVTSRRDRWGQSVIVVECSFVFLSHAPQLVVGAGCRLYRPCSTTCTQWIQLYTVVFNQ